MIKLLFYSLVMLLFMKNLVVEFYMIVMFLLLIWQVSMLPLGEMSDYTYFNYQLSILSSSLLLLTFWINFLLMMYSTKMIMNKSSNMLLANIFVLSGLVSLFFVSQKLIIFYINFELSLIPIFMIILGWGYQSERFKASLMFMFYTIGASLPLLMIFLFMNTNYSIFSFIISAHTPNNLFLNLSKGPVLMISLAFLIKVPMFLTHLWLPKAHTEAPVLGSMILAAILLKLGTFGIFTIMTYYINYKNWNWVFSVSLVGGLLMSLLCLYLTDLKMIIAYSSVAHMAMALMAMSVSNVIGVVGAIFVMLAHGFTSSGMFLSANIIYEHSNSRSIIFNKGIIYQSSSFVMFWFFLSICNMGVPPTLNFFSEIFMIMSMMSLSYLNSVGLFLMMLFTFGYCLIIFSSPLHGKNKMNINNKVSYLMEFLNLFMHLFWSFLFIVALYVYM